MLRQFTLPFGEDGENLTLPTGPTQIAGIRVDNPSSSWLRVAQIQDFVPPYTMGWARSLNPAALTVTVVWSGAPSGAPSAQDNTNAATVTLYDTPQADDMGYPSGAAEVQQPGVSGIQFAFLPFDIEETIDPQRSTLVSSDPTRYLVLIRWRVYASAITAYDNIRTIARVFAASNATGVAVFPDAVVSPETPDSGFQNAIGARSLALGDFVDIGGMVDPGGGLVGLTAYIEYLEVLGV